MRSGLHAATIELRGSAGAAFQAALTVREQQHEVAVNLPETA
jgi:hypothetical protein